MGNMGRCFCSHCLIFPFCHHSMYSYVHWLPVLTDVCVCVRARAFILGRHVHEGSMFVQSMGTSVNYKAKHARRPCL
jgi:hypothetical protein